MRNLSRILFVTGIVVFSTIIAAGSCGKKKEGSSLMLEVKSLDESTVKVVEKNGEATVKIIETKAFGKVAAASSDYDGHTAKDVLKDVFTVSIKDSKAGFVFSNPYTTTKSIDKMTANIAVSIDGESDSFVSTITKDGETLSRLGLVSTWISRGFSSKKKTPKIGFICTSVFELSGERVEEITTIAIAAASDDDDKETKEAKEKLEKSTDSLAGAQKATCGVGGTSITAADYKDWVKDDDGVSQIELLFAGVDFGSTKMGDLYKVAPGLISAGLTSKSMKSIIKAYPSGSKKVNVTLVGALD